jgi:hypothetical protein
MGEDVRPRRIARGCFRLAFVHDRPYTDEGGLLRLLELVRSALLSGLVLLLVVALAPLLRRGRRDAVTVAAAAMLVTAVVGVVGGGYYWTHQPDRRGACDLCAGRARGRRRLAAVPARRRRSRRREPERHWRRGGDRRDPRGPSGTSEVGSLSAWLDAARCPGDSAVVLCGEASVFETTKLRPAYPYLWTLPQRILDPHLTHLVHTLDRRRAPTFVVVRSSLDSWRQDPHGRLRGILDRRYRLVADIGGDLVYLRRGEPRSTTGARLCTRAASGADTPVRRHPAQRNPQVEPTARTRSRHQVGSYRAGHPPRQWKAEP